MVRLAATRRFIKQSCWVFRRKRVTRYILAGWCSWDKFAKQLNIWLGDKRCDRWLPAIGEQRLSFSFTVPSWEGQRQNLAWVLWRAAVCIKGFSGNKMNTILALGTFKIWGSWHRSATNHVQTSFESVHETMKIDTVSPPTLTFFEFWPYLLSWEWSRAYDNVLKMW